MALLELVDNPRDFKLEMTARACRSGAAHGQVAVENAKGGQLRSVTRGNLQKVLRYRGGEALADISQKATAHIESLLARPILQQRTQVAENSRAENAKAPYGVAFPKTSLHAGFAVPGEVRPAGQLAKGALTRTGWTPRSRLGSANKGPPRPSAYTAQTLRPS
ncbi:hypothetical protein JVT61DRAFT_5652 [Boletus reticuloceps]|uniref:Uncharacterized protein n=1 Tax=Boletus reticuloceps TaxID=495285 RepID=A0A8I3ADE6_9AGAM|nr:hypothetical protein JVT61DRAFT_5652 [Boletus reticuloceps]